jgi:hypothetical protein
MPTKDKEATAARATVQDQGEPPKCSKCGKPLLKTNGVPALWICPPCRAAEVAAISRGTYFELARDYKYDCVLSLSKYREWPQIQHLACEFFDHKDGFTEATQKRLEVWLLAYHFQDRNALWAAKRSKIVELLRAAVDGPPHPAVETPPATPPAVSVTTTPAPTTAAVVKGEGVAPRNRWFLAQYNARGTDTYHRPKRIQEKWWAMKDEERAAICPDAPGKVSLPAVVQGIKRARLGKATKPKAKRTR